MRRRRFAFLLVGTAIAAVVAIWSVTQPSIGAVTAGPVTVTAARILNFRIADTQTRFGKLEFVGGLQLESGSQGFGGFSGFRFLDDRERFIAISDKCVALTGVLVRDVTGAPDNIASAALQPLPIDPAARLEAWGGWSDCEAVATANGGAYVAFEGSGWIGGFSIDPAGQLSGFTRFSPEKLRQKFKRNKGIESLAAFPPGSQLAGGFLTIAEDTPDASGNHQAFIVGPAGIAQLHIARTDDYAITDADFLPDGDLVILERRFGLGVKTGVRIRRFPLAEIQPGAVLAGEVLMEADTTCRIDNMEGIAATLDSEGRTTLTLISDDNFNFFQSNLLLEFRLAE